MAPRPDNQKVSATVVLPRCRLSAHWYLISAIRRQVSDSESSMQTSSTTVLFITVLAMGSLAVDTAKTPATVSLWTTAETIILEIGPRRKTAICRLMRRLQGQRSTSTRSARRSGLTLERMISRCREARVRSAAAWILVVAWIRTSTSSTTQSANPGTSVRTSLAR